MRAENDLKRFKMAPQEKDLKDLGENVKYSNIKYSMEGLPQTELVIRAGLYLVTTVIITCRVYDTEL